MTSHMVTPPPTISHTNGTHIVAVGTKIISSTGSANSTSVMNALAGLSTASLADESGDYMQVPATIESIDTVTGMARVRLEIPRQLTPAAVRYAWRSWGPAPLFNEAGLPAFPFAHLRAN